MITCSSNCGGGNDGSNGNARSGGDHSKRFDVGYVAGALAQLHEQVCRSRVRVEVTRDGTDECCVLISKQELDALERALAILANTDELRAISERISQLASMTRGAYATTPV